MPTHSRQNAQRAHTPKEFDNERESVDNVIRQESIDEIKVIDNARESYVLIVPHSKA